MRTLFDYFCIPEFSTRIQEWSDREKPNIWITILGWTKNFTEISGGIGRKFSEMLTDIERKSFTEFMTNAGFPLSVSGSQIFANQTNDEKLLARMQAKDLIIIEWLRENDPGFLIEWEEKICKVCFGTKRQWAKRCLACNDELLEILNAVQCDIEAT